jgi:DNA-binding NarL/FixJ family response regulator
MDSISPNEQEMRVSDCAEISTRLTPMQLKILNGVQSGLLNKQIAYDLGIAEATVKAHMTVLMRKLNVRNRTQVALAAQAMQRGLRAAAN